MEQGGANKSLSSGLISREGVEAAIEGLAYRNHRTLKYKLVDAVRAHHLAAGPMDSPSALHGDEIIRILWDVAGDPSAVVSKRRNLHSIRSSVNKELVALYDTGGNPEGLIIGPEYTFVQCEEAKEKALESYKSLFGDENSLTEIERLKAALEGVRQVMDSSERDAADLKMKLDSLDALRELVKGLAETLGVQGVGDGRIPSDDARGLGEPAGFSAPGEGPAGILEEGEEFEEVEDLDDGSEALEDGLEDVEEVGDGDDGLEVSEDELEEVEAVDESPEVSDEDLEDVEEVGDIVDGLEIPEGELEEVEDEEESPEVLEEEFEEVEEVGDGDDGLEVSEDELEEVEAVDESPEVSDEDLEDVEEVGDIVDGLEIPEGELEEVEDEEESPEVSDEDLEDVEEVGDGDDGLEIPEDELEEVEEVEEVDELPEVSGEDFEDVEEAAGEEGLSGGLEGADASDLGGEWGDPGGGGDVPGDALPDEDDDFLEEEGEYEPDPDSLDGLQGLEEELGDGGASPEKARVLAEEFNRSLAAMDRYFNQYILIPAGEYPTGRNGLSRVNLPAFYIGKFPVTNALFELFVEKTGYRTTAEREGHGTVYQGRYRTVKDERTGKETLICNRGLISARVRGACWYCPAGPGSTLRNKRNHPVVQVSLEDAMAFAAWTGKRLPSEEEWEAAMATKRGYAFPWGAQWKEAACNTEESCLGDTSGVDDFLDHANEFGIADGLGNVQEWTLTRGDGSDPELRVAKGAGWIARDREDLRSRRVLHQKTRSNILGFRCSAY